MGPAAPPQCTLPSQLGSPGRLSCLFLRLRRGGGSEIGGSGPEGGLGLVGATPSYSSLARRLTHSMKEDAITSH